MMGVIPGNMRDGSFIVRGKGCSEALYSSSHGAGRVMGRKQAKAELSLDKFKESMLGITGKIDESTLDEACFAYKNIFEVMRLQEDLVEVVDYVKPLINIKG
jgi:tRNA-splicing ligase RtcB